MMISNLRNIVENYPNSVPEIIFYKIIVHIFGKINKYGNLKLMM
jgi:hypothetical protein